MHENPNEQRRNWDVMERETLYFLTEPDRRPTICAVADIGRHLETRDPMAVIRPLICAGLLHRTADNFVFVTPAAYHLVGLVGHVV